MIRPKTNGQRLYFQSQQDAEEYALNINIHITGISELLWNSKPPTNRNKRREGPRLYFPPAKPADCIIKNMPSSRCQPMTSCPHYWDCLDFTSKHNWQGWKIAE